MESEEIEKDGEGTTANEESGDDAEPTVETEEPQEDTEVTDESAPPERVQKYDRFKKVDPRAVRPRQRLHP